MTECEKLHNDLKAFLDGQLSPAARIAMRLHLNRCASCRKEIEEMRLLGTSMRASDNLEMSEALRARILASVPTAAPDAKVPMIPKWREKPVLIWGASASALMAWFVLYPAIDNYQRHASRSATIVSNTKQIDNAGMMYTQDYDQPNDGEIVRANDGEIVRGAKEIVRNGIVSSYDHLSAANGYQLTQGRTMIGAGETVHVARESTDHRSDRQYIPPSKNLLAEGTRATNGRIEAHDGRLKTMLAQRFTSVNGKTEMFETALAKPGQKHWRGYAPASSFLDDLPTERQVHKEANLTVEVANAEQESESVERLVKEAKGYVAQNQLSTVEDNTRQATLTCKVPVDQFDTVMGQLARLGLLKGKTLSGEDITEKVSDEQETGHVLRADIATTEEKLKVRKRHSETVRDEETLRQLRIRVAQSQARLKMLTRLGALSQITVELDEKPKNAVPQTVKPVSPFMEEMGSTGQAAAHSFLMALRLPVQLLVWMVVYSPLWALLIFGYRRMTR